MWCQFFQPDIIVVVQTRFVVIDEHRSGDVHRSDYRQDVTDDAFFNTGLNLGGYVYEGSTSRHLEPQFFAIK
jgi:hypothetical protein